MVDEQAPDAKTIEVPNLPIREELVSTAVNFLLNPEVVNKPAFNKEAFLRKKGLTDAEISQAFQKAEVESKHNSGRNYAHNYPVPSPLPPAERQHSFWSQLSTVSSSAILFGVALFGIYRFYKLYIEPWLFGKVTDENRLSEMEQQLLEMNTSLCQLKKAVTTVEEAVTSQKVQIDHFLQTEVNEYLPTPVALKNLRDEIGSIKSLLLSRHQFPAVPKVSPSIPVWQLPAKESDENETASKEEEEHARASSPVEQVINGTLESSDIAVNGAVLDDSRKEAEFEDALESA